MLQETTAHQDVITNNIKSSKMKTDIFGKVFGRLIVKMRKKNNKPKCHLEDYNNRCSQPQLTVLSSSSKSSTSVSSSPLTPLTIITEYQPTLSTSVTSFSDNELESTVDGSILNHKASMTSEALTIISSVLNNEEIVLSSNDQGKVETPKKMEKSDKKLFRFTRFTGHNSIRNWRNNHSNATLNSLTESSNSEQIDSAYETEPEPENYFLTKKKKPQEDKIIRKTKLTTLSSRDKEYIEVQKLFKVGLPSKKIRGIVRLQMPTKLVEAHEQYKKQVAQKSDLPESNICHRMFHGTKTAMICKPQHFINNKCALFCKFGCGACGIIQEGNRTKYSRYTQRMWFASNSATSLSYCSNSNVKAMFVVDVVSTTSNSILIIEKDEATIPRYLIVFQ